MKLVLLFITLVSIVGCTTFQSTQDSIRRSCKSGVSEYDDGTVNYKCQYKDLTHEQGGSKQ